MDFQLGKPRPTKWSDAQLQSGRSSFTLTGCPGGQCSRYQPLTRGTSSARRVKPERRLNGRGAHKSAIPLAVLSVYSGHSWKQEGPVVWVDYSLKTILRIFSNSLRPMVNSTTGLDICDLKKSCKFHQYKARYTTKLKFQFHPQWVLVEVWLVLYKNRHNSIITVTSLSSLKTMIW